MLGVLKHVASVVLVACPFWTSLFEQPIIFSGVDWGHSHADKKAK